MTRRTDGDALCTQQRGSNGGFTPRFGRPTRGGGVREAGVGPNPGPATTGLSPASAHRCLHLARSREPCAHLGTTREPYSPELARRLHGNGRSTQTPARGPPNKERSHWLECRACQPIGVSACAARCLGHLLVSGPPRGDARELLLLLRVLGAPHYATYSD